MTDERSTPSAEATEADRMVAGAGFAPGDPVEWRRQARGGYGTFGWIPAVVERVYPSGLVRVRADLKRGGSLCRIVHAENLTAHAFPKSERPKSEASEPAPEAAHTDQGAR